MFAATHQPTMRRLNASTMKHTYAIPDRVGTYVRSVTHKASGRSAFFAYLERRARRKQQREGQSPFVVGGMPALYKLKDQALVRRRRMEIVIAQPGLSAAAAEPGHLELLAATESYLRSTIAAPLSVWCSA
jgi:hypothetical protein